MKHLTIFFILIGLLLPSIAAATGDSSAKLELENADWSLGNKKRLNSVSKDEVWKYINSLQESTGLGKLCSFTFADLRHSGQLTLIVSDDGGGSMDCNDVEVFDKTRKGVEDFNFQSVGMFWFDDVKDIHNDGKTELILDTILSAPLGGDHCWATWPVIYAWTGNGYGDVSSQFKNYYQQQLAKMRGQLAAPRPTPAAPPIETYESRPPGVEARFATRFIGPSPSPVATPAPEPDRTGLDCDKAYEAKLERFLGISRDAGMSDAIKWANSDDPQDRKFAMAILSDIGTTQALEYLKTLSHDPDRNVAMSAKLYLNGPKMRTTYPTVKGELIPLTPGYPPAN